MEDSINHVLVTVSTMPEQFVKTFAPRPWKEFFSTESTETASNMEDMRSRSQQNIIHYHHNYQVVVVGFVLLAMLTDVFAVVGTLVAAIFTFIQIKYPQWKQRTEVIKLAAVSYVLYIFFFTYAVQLSIFGVLAGLAFSLVHSVLHELPPFPT